MNKAKFPKIKYLLVFAVIAVLVAGTVLLSFVFKNKIDVANYEERKESLAQLIETSARAVNDNIETQWQISKVYENDLKSHINDYDNVNDYMVYLNTQLSNDKDYFFLVDSIGNYYCSDGICGKINNTKYFFDDTEDKIEFLDTLPHFDNDITYLILRTRLSEPVTATGNNGPVNILYCCLMHDMTSLNETIDDLFDENNNTIIFDTDNGMMLYKQFTIGLLIDGYNIYGKYEKVDLKFGTNYTDIVSEIKNRQTNVSLMDLNGEDYYLCSSPLEIANWSIFLVVRGTYFNETSHNAFGEIFYTITIILFVLCLLFILLFWYLNKLRYSQKATEAMKEAYQLKSNFLSYMSHDIRTPINGIIGISNIGIANSEDKEKTEDSFKKITLSAKHLLSIVNDVLDMSAIEAGKVVLQEENMNINDTLTECMDIIKGTLNGRDLKLVKEFNCENYNVIGDAFHLKQVIINILSNAVKFTEDGGTITLSCKQLESKTDIINYEISVADTGIGMSEEFKKHIFEAFKTEKSEGKTKYKGSGLGMAISKEYVELMKGSISVASKLGVGSTFTINMPFTKAEETAEVNQLSELNVLLVDDNEINLEIAQAMLEGEVKSITLAHNGKEAVETFLSSAENTFNLILMDVLMPEMNGLDATRAIRGSDRRDNDIYIVALTANTYKDDVDAIYLAGIDDYLTKPFATEQLKEKIKLRK